MGQESCGSALLLRQCGLSRPIGFNPMSLSKLPSLSFWAVALVFRKETYGGNQRMELSWSYTDIQLCWDLVEYGESFEAGSS